jgi:phage baseplate assembly protein V
MIRGIVKTVTAKAGAIMRFSASGRTGEQIEDREVFQQYGFASRPKAGAECIMIRSGAVIVMVGSEDRRVKIALNEGDVALYTSEGNKIVLKPSGEVVVTSSGKIVLDSGTVELGGTAQLKKLVHEGILTALNTHVHSTAAGPTGAAQTPLLAPNPFTESLHTTSNARAK